MPALTEMTNLQVLIETTACDMLVAKIDQDINGLIHAGQWVLGTEVRNELRTFRSEMQDLEVALSTMRTRLRLIIERAPHMANEPYSPTGEPTL